MTFEQAVNSPPGGKTVAITFDDAYRSLLTHGRPVLDALGWPATVFVPTSFPDAAAPMTWPGIEQWAGGPHEHELIALTWEQLAELASSGWEIASHTCSHPRLTTLEDDDLAHELTASRVAVENRVQQPCTTIAYPYGDVDTRVEQASRTAGYTAGAGLLGRSDVVRVRRGGQRTAMNWPRVGIYHGDDDRRFQLKVSVVSRALQRTWGAR